MKIPTSIESTAIQLYNGPVGRAPGKTAIKINVLMALTIIPDFGPTNRNAIIIGISQNEKNKNGASGKGIFGPYTFRAAARAVNIMISDKALVFNNCSSVVSINNYLFNGSYSKLRMFFEFGLKYINKQT
jgi:hypothetical protein